MISMASECLHKYAYSHLLGESVSICLTHPCTNVVVCWMFENLHNPYEN